MKYRLLTGYGCLVIASDLNRDITLRHLPDDLIEHLRIQADQSSLFDRPVDNRLNSHLHVIGGKPDRIYCSVNQNTVENTHGRSGGNRTHDDSE